jgi:hypothetical protein
LVVEHESAGAYTRAISDPRSPFGQEKKETKPSRAASEKPSTAVSEKPSDSPKPPASSPTPKPLPPLKVPKTSFEFESSWKKVKTYPADSARKYDFLKSVDPANVCVLFRGGAPAELSDVVLTLLKGCSNGKVQLEHCTKFLEELIKTPRFDVAVLFISAQRKTEMSRTWDDLAGGLGKTDDENDCATRLANARHAYKA